MLLSPSPAYHEMQAGKACDYSGVSSFAVVAVEYTLAVILHILRLTGTTKGLDTLMALSLSPSCHGMQADKACDSPG
jgi:hypothetical protein